MYKPIVSAHGEKGEKMERLIDANELYVDARFGENEEPYISLYQINNAPTVDAVEIVRCKDCKWYENDGYHTNCKIMRCCVEGDDYCSRGERRGEQDE